MPRLTLQAMLESVKRQVGDARDAHSRQTAAEIAACRKPWLDEWTPLLTSDEEPLNTYRVIHDINSTLDWENSIVYPRRRRAA